MTVTIDTNILLHLLRNSYLVPTIQQQLDQSAAEDTIIISIVSVGEIESIAHQRNYGANKRDYLTKLLQDFLTVPIYSMDVVERYAEIDAYSQGNLMNKPLPDGLSSRNMGKNDLWIATTASITNTPLLTTDKDFEHLEGEYIDYLYIDPDG